MIAFPRLVPAALLFALPAFAQQPTMSVEDYAPRSTLRVPAHPTPRAKFPFIDVHGHQTRLESDADVDRLSAKWTPSTCGRWSI